MNNLIYIKGLYISPRVIDFLMIQLYLALNQYLYQTSLSMTICVDIFNWKGAAHRLLQRPRGQGEI
jgi:hypothetical protein